MLPGNGYGNFTRPTIRGHNTMHAHRPIDPVKKHRHPSQTPATHWLEQHGIPYSCHTYDYREHGGARHAAEQLGIDLRIVAKTLVMEDERAKPLIIVMRGDREVSVKHLARQIGAKKITPCVPATAERHSGYFVGGTSPFGTRKTMPVWVEASLLESECIYINGGKRGLLISLSPQALTASLGAQSVEASIA